MTACDAFVQRRSEGASLGADDREHLAHCDGACPSLMAFDDHLAAGLREVRDDEAMPASLAAVVRAESAPVRRVSTARRLLPAGLVMLAFSAAMAVILPRVDLAHQPRSRLVAGWLVMATSAVAAWWTAGAPGALGLGLRAGWQRAVAAVVGAVMVGATAALTVPVEGSIVTHPQAVMLGVLCGLEGVVIAAAVAAVLVRSLGRRTVSPESAGVVLGIGAGCAGALVQHLSCGMMVYSHTLTAHVAPLVVGAAVGGWVGRRWLAV